MIAISRRRSGDSAAARALPPLWPPAIPPRRPSTCAALGVSPGSAASDCPDRRDGTPATVGQRVRKGAGSTPAGTYQLRASWSHLAPNALAASFAWKGTFR
jgi:hypothetical protein